MDVALLVWALRRGLEGVDDGFRVVVDGANIGGEDLRVGVPEKLNNRETRCSTAAGSACKCQTQIVDSTIFETRRRCCFPPSALVVSGVRFWNAAAWKHIRRKVWSEHSSPPC